MNLNLNVNDTSSIILNILQILLGLQLLYFGKKLIKYGICIQLFFITFYICQFIVVNNEENFNESILYFNGGFDGLILSLGWAISSVILAWYLFDVAIFFLASLVVGGSVKLIISLLIPIQDTQISLLTLFIPGIIGGITSIYYFDKLTIVSTSILGGEILLTGLDSFFNVDYFGIFNSITNSNVVEINIHNWALLFSLFFISTSGVLFQLANLIEFPKFGDRKSKDIYQLVKN